MEIWRLKRWTQADGRSGDFIVCPMLCIALDGQKGVHSNTRVARHAAGFWQVRLLSARLLS